MNTLLKCLWHAFVLLVLHLVYYNLNWSFGEEAEVLGLINKTETFLLRRGNFSDSSFLFVNTAYDHQLADVETPFGDSGKVGVVDREMLGSFVDGLARRGNRHGYLLCDILLDLPTPGDSLLADATQRVRKMLLPKHYSKYDSGFVGAWFGGKSALSDYITYEGQVGKMMLYSPALKEKTIPLVMYEDLTASIVTPGRLGLWEGGHYVPNVVYPRYYFDAYTVPEFEMTLKQANMLLHLSDSLAYDRLFRNRIIVIGNFVADRHVTPVGFLPGSVVLLNSYLTLRDGYHRHSAWWFLLMFAIFGGLSYLELFYPGTRHAGLSPAGRVWKFLGLTGLWGGLHTTVIPIIVYFHLIHWFHSIRKHQHHGNRSTVH